MARSRGTRSPAWGSIASLLASFLLSCAAKPPAVLDAGLPGGRLHRALDALAAAAPLGPEETFRAEELGRDGHTSHHLVQIRHGETLHRHDRHDLLVVLLRGHGRMRLGDGYREVGEGSILYVPRGMPHAFENGSEAPAAAYVLYLPAFDGQDRVGVDPEAEPLR